MEWPEGVSDGLILACSDCGQVPKFDYTVKDSFWKEHVGGEEQEWLGVVCLPCLDLRCGGKGLAEALIKIQWTGTRHTVVFLPIKVHVY